MSESKNRAWKALAAAVLALLAFYLGVEVPAGDDGAKTVTVVATPTATPTPTPGATTPAEAELEVRPPFREFDADVPGGPDANAEPPAAVEDKQADQVDSGTYDTSGVLRGAAAQPARRKCPTDMNGGPRSVKDIGLMVAHVTVSLNVVGPGDGDSLCDFFRRVQASPTWTVDNEGNSWQNVALTKIPWTQAWYNKPSCSIEYIGSTGRPGEGPAQWTTAQLKEGGRLFARCAKLAGIPIRSGRVGSFGNIIQTGLITHQELGLKGGGHSDPGPHWSRAEQLKWIRFYARGGCGKRCRARKVHIATHASLRRLHCGSVKRSAGHPGACAKLKSRNAALHRRFGKVI